MAAVAGRAACFPHPRHRPGRLLAQQSQLFALNRATLGSLFDGVQLRYVGQHRPHPCRVCLERLVHVPARVRPAADFHHSSLGIGEETVVRHVGIGLQIAAIAFQEALRSGAFSGRCVVVNDGRMIAIADIRPDATSSRLRQPAIQDLHRRVIGADHLRSQYEFL